MRVGQQGLRVWRNLQRGYGVSVTGQCICYLHLASIPYLDIVVNATRIYFVALLGHSYRRDGKVGLNVVDCGFLTRVPYPYATIVAAAED
jgi:hypothetical protein